MRIPVQQIGGCALARDEGLVLGQHLRLEEVHVVRVVVLRPVLQGVVVSPVEVVRLSPLALHHQRVLANILIQRCGTTFLGADAET